MRSAAPAALFLCIVSVQARADEQPASTRFGAVRDDVGFEGVTAPLAAGNEPDADLLAGGPAPDTTPTPMPASTWSGTAQGSIVVDGTATPLSFAYAVVVRPRKATGDQIHVVLSEKPIPLEVLDDLIHSLPTSGVCSLRVALDTGGVPLSTFFHHESLATGLEVRGVARYASAAAPAGRVAGKLTFDDPDFSWTFSAQFDAPVYRPVRRPSRADDPSLSPQERARVLLAEQHLEPTYGGLRKAVLDEDADLVSLYLDAGVPATSGDRRRGLLDEAIGTGNVEVVKLLLGKGANANGEDYGGRPLVMWVAADKESTLLAALLDAGADPNARAAESQTPLISASIGGNLGNVELLLKRGAEVNARMSSGTTALGMAVALGHVAIVRKLIEAGADVAREREDLLESARRIGNEAIEKLILDTSEVVPKKATPATE